MDSKAYTNKIADMDQQERFEDSTENCPNPADFDVFLPLVCKIYGVEVDVIVTRSIQTVYVSAAMKKRDTKKPSLKRPSSVTTHEKNNRSEIEYENIPDVSNKIFKIKTIYNSNENLVQVKFLMNKKIPRKVMQVLALTLPYQQHLTSITINSGLKMDSFYELSKCLPISQITELCLDGTSLSQANYGMLLTNSKLKHLSLARCTLNDATVKSIVDQLKEPCPATRTLSALNLSTNGITDIGAKYLAEVLRTNRQLSYLNLAGNMITDEGGVSILNTLQKFPLYPQELLDIGARYAARLKERNDLIISFISELQTPTSTKSSRKKLTKKIKIENQNKHQHFDLSAETQIIREKAEFLADNKLGSDEHNEPFSPNNVETQNSVMCCFGNNTLCYLNLAYNNLTYDSVKKLVEVLRLQQSLNRTPRGLIKVVIEGNLMPEYCKEFEEIESVLKRGTRQPDFETKKRFSKN